MLQRQLQVTNGFGRDRFVAALCVIFRLPGFQPCPIVGVFWHAHLPAPTTRTSPTMKWILAETLSQHGVLQPYVVFHEAGVEMDSSYQQTLVDSSYRGRRTIFVGPIDLRNFPQVHSLNLQSHRATHPCKISTEMISFRVAPANCFAKAVDTPASCKRRAPHTMGSWPDNEALTMPNNLQSRTPFCPMEHYWLTAILQLSA